MWWGLTILTITGFSIPALARAGDASLFQLDSNKTTWKPHFTAGMDAYLQTYALATDDTTETLAEFMVAGSITGQSSRKVRHRWRLQAEGSVGTQLYRERLEAEYRFQDKQRRPRIRVRGIFRGRQYRDNSEYILNSDVSEGLLDLRTLPVAGRRTALEIRGWAGFMDYRTPSTLEVDHRDLGAGAFFKSTGLGSSVWSVGSRIGSRTYPDSTQIDRKTMSLEGVYDFQDLMGQGIHAYHKSERRRIRDTSARPSAWSHWTDLAGKVAAGPGKVFLDLQSEIWKYDEDLPAYYNSWRVKGTAGYSWGDILSTTWRLGLAAENLEAKESPEAYTSFGLVGGAEAYAGVVSGSLILEIGRRLYQDGVVDLDGEAGEDPISSESFQLYSDFSYWEIWLTAQWQIARQWSLDIMASYEPENHTEREDDVNLGFASVRLIFRP